MTLESPQIVPTLNLIPDPEYLANVTAGPVGSTGWARLKALLETAVSSSGNAGAISPWHIYKAGVLTGHDPLYMAQQTMPIATAGWFEGQREIIRKDSLGTPPAPSSVPPVFVNDLWLKRFEEFQRSGAFIPITAQETKETAEAQDAWKQAIADHSAEVIAKYGDPAVVQPPSTDANPMQVPSDCNDCGKPSNDSTPTGIDAILPPPPPMMDPPRTNMVEYNGKWISLEEWNVIAADLLRQQRTQQPLVNPPATIQNVSTTPADTTASAAEGPGFSVQFSWGLALIVVLIVYLYFKS